QRDDGDSFQRLHKSAAILLKFGDVSYSTRILMEIPSAIYAVSHRAVSRIRRRYSAIFSSPGMLGSNWPKNKLAEMSNPPCSSSRLGLAAATSAPSKGPFEEGYTS